MYCREASPPGNLGQKPVVVGRVQSTMPTTLLPSSFAAGTDVTEKLPPTQEQCSSREALAARP